MINNAFYEELKEGWHNLWDHPIALLRAENRVRAPWMANELHKRILKPAKVLDIGCGGGFLTNHLAEWGHAVTGIDLSPSSLEAAHQNDKTKTVAYLPANAYDLPFKDRSFDAVSAMDILEHVENPGQLLSEASRVLRPGGLFFFHTFNRNLLSYLMIIKGVEWFVKNTPKNMHVYSLFITPKELKKKCQQHHLHVDTLLGFRPKIFTQAFLKLLMTRRISPEFTFTFTKDLTTGYSGIASKN
jgi:2-polyprenyl-6-hydroxyphenyl methylase / 3-demethylubiquinone-9 3-methyltransferase